jgi:lipopolysaccharide export system permease protein
MTYGSLGENYELVAIKSAGISLRRAMYPMMVVVVLLSIAAFFFSDYMLPVANLKYYSLLYDARKQKSADLLPENVFTNRFPGYAIRVKSKDPDGQTLYGIMIYQKEPQGINQRVTFAKSGLMYRTKDDLFLVLKLKDGVSYEEKPGEMNYNSRQQFTRFRFKETEQKLDLSGFKMERTNENEFRNASMMMNLRQLQHYIDSSGRQVDSSITVNYKLVSPNIKYFAVPSSSKTVKNPIPADSLLQHGLADKMSALNNASTEIRQVQEVLRFRVNNYRDTTKSIRRYIMEYQKKFTLGAACIVLFLIGAPLGAIIRKGGLGLPVVVSVAFFLVYYIIGTIGEKSAKEGDLSPFIGAWIAIVFLFPIGLFLTYKAATDSALFDADIYKRFFKRLLPGKPKPTQP